MDRRGAVAPFHLELWGGTMISVAIPLLLVVGVIAVVGVVATQRSGKDQEGSGGPDIVPYLVLAMAVGVAGFALADLAATAFPGERFVFDPAEDLATSLSALVVSAPFVVYFWRRQAVRRQTHPGAAGWALYLAAMELVFVTALIVTAVLFINALFGDEPATAWPRAVVFGAIVVFHELAARGAPPVSDAGELRRVIGSALGLITAAAGLTGTIAAAIAAAYEGVSGIPPWDPGFEPWAAMAIIGVPIWWYRWIRPWDAPPAVPRLTWAALGAVIALATAVGAGTAILVQVVEYIATSTADAGQHFEPLPVTLALVFIGVPVWLAHRQTLHEVEGSALGIYRYAIAALGLGTSVSMLIALTLAALDRDLLIEASARDILTLATVLVVGLAVWLVYERRATAAEGPDRSWPRNIYTIGVGIIFGLVAAGALITTLFVLLRRLLGASEFGGLLEATVTLVYTGLAAWYLLAAHFRDRAATPADTVTIAPFDVTVICSHPGPLATKFPNEAQMRVLYRGDDAGAVDEAMATEIVASVANASSFVWVDEDGFRVAPVRSS